MDKLFEMLTDVFDAAPGEITPDTDFREDLLADECDFWEIAFNIEELYGKSVPDRAWKTIVTVQDLIDYIGRK